MSDPKLKCDICGKIGGCDCAENLEKWDKEEIESRCVYCNGSGCPHCNDEPKECRVCGMVEHADDCPELWT